MIIEGKHAEVGRGIFVSDIQEGSAAEQVIFRFAFGNLILRELLHPLKRDPLQAGLQVGDMILAVNMDSLAGCTYDEVRVFHCFFAARNYFIRIDIKRLK